MNGDGASDLTSLGEVSSLNHLSVWILEITRGLRPDTLLSIFLIGPQRVYSVDS